MEEVLFWGWDLNFPVSGATSTMAGGAILAARWLHKPQRISNPPVWLGFPHRAGQYRARRISVSVSGLLELQRHGGISYPGMGAYPSCEQRNLDFGRRGNPRRGPARLVKIPEDGPQ